MTAALAPYSALDEFRDASQAINAVQDLLARNGGELIVLKQLPTDREERFSLHCRAHEALDWVPIKRLVEVYKEVKKVIWTEPPPKERQLLIGIMLDGLGIRAGDDTDGYIGALSFELADIHPPAYHGDLPRFIPLPAIAHGIQRIWRTYGETYGRPPPISMLREQFSDSRRDLGGVLAGIDRIGRSYKALKQIVKATEDSYPPDDDWDDKPKEQTRLLTSSGQVPFEMPKERDAVMVGGAK